MCVRVCVNVCEKANYRRSDHGWGRARLISKWGVTGEDSRSGGVCVEVCDRKVK